MYKPGVSWILEGPPRYRGGSCEICTGQASTFKWKYKSRVYVLCVSGRGEGVAHTRLDCCDSIQPRYILLDEEKVRLKLIPPRQRMNNRSRSTHTLGVNYQILLLKALHCRIIQALYPKHVAKSQVAIINTVLTFC